MARICPECGTKYGADAEFCDKDGAVLSSLSEGARRISETELKTLLHPSEESRYVLALLVAVPAAFLSMLVVLVTFGLLLIYVALIAGSVWFFLSIVKARLVANSVKVSPHNFPEVYDVATEVKHMLDFDEPLDIFIIEEGTVNALIAKFFGTKFIVLHSELVEEMIDGEDIAQLRWIIGRFVGALKAKHYRFTLMRLLIDGIEKIKIFNLLLLPYERATQYSGDQIGLVVCDDLPQAMIAFDKFMVGNRLAERVTMRGVVDQARETRDSFFAMLARIWSTHPHMVDRYENLLAFAKWRDPEMFAAYVRELHPQAADHVQRDLPPYGGGTPPASRAAA